MFESKPFTQNGVAVIQFPTNSFGVSITGKLTVTANVRSLVASVGVVAQSVRVDASCGLVPPPVYLSHLAQWDEVLLAASPQNPGASAGFSAICEIAAGTVLIVTGGFQNLDPGDVGSGSLSVVFEPLSL
jgi:hypothetical protein